MKKIDVEKLRLSAVDLELICKALTLYTMQVSVLNADIFKISEDDLSDINNDTQYIDGLIAHIKSVVGPEGAG